MAHVLIVYYSRTGHTKEMADLVAEGAKGEGVKVICQPVEDTALTDLVEADGIIIGSPTYYGTMAAEVKRLIDESVEHHRGLVGKVGGAFSSAGGPGGGAETTVLDILKALLIHGMIIPGDVQGDHYGPTAVGAPDERSAKQCRRRGALVAQLVKRLVDTASAE
jgi:NAD(P)H dehydrogenase (quinone)